MAFIAGSPGLVFGRRMKKTGMDRVLATMRVWAFALSVLYIPIANAQGTLPQTPPELKDFRLDKKPETPKEAAPVIIVPDVKPAAPSAKPSPQRQVTTQRPKSRAQTHSKAASTIEMPSPTKPAPPPESPVAATVLSQPDSAPVTDISPPGPAIGVSASRFDPAFLPWGWIAGALALAAIGVFGLAKFRTRAAREQGEMVTQNLNDDASKTIEMPSAPPVMAPVIGEGPPASIIAEPPVEIKRPVLDISFVPNKATVSLANLTISGQLRIINQGSEAARTMKLRTILISASEVQNNAIAQFHASKDMHFTEDLGAAGSAEKIAMDLELSIPLSELQSYPLGDQRLFVPIMLANIEYDWGKDGHDVTQIACMIGREANPPQAKMAPLRLDLGPRSFAPLGQRPVFG
jgi:hypothetical protein